MEKILRVNLTDQSISSQEPKDLARFRGRGLTSTIVASEVPAHCHPLGVDNKLVIAPGLLSGTNAANSGRLSVGAKSPLTGGIKESNVGGTAATKLARIGVWGLVVEGMSPAGRLFYLLVNKDGASLLPADEYKGMKNYELAEKLLAKHPRAGVISIGPAGENRMSAATIAVTDLQGHPARHAGRGGMGAVMGSKGLKAVVVDDAGARGVDYADHDGFKKAARAFRDGLSGHPVTKPGGGLSTFGTNILVNILNAAGGLPTRNFTQGNFEGAGKISGEALYDTIKKRGGSTTHTGCSTCIIQCSNVFLDENENYVTSALEYETVWAHGANLGVDDLDSIARVDRMCDELGIDTIETGCAIGVAMAAGVKEFGDAKGALELVAEIGKASALGRILGNGAAVTGQAFGVTHVPVVKKQSMPAYDPRAVKGMGVTYATTTMGADHTAGYATTANIMRVGGFVDPLKPDGQVELSRNLQIASAALDSTGLCLFTAFAILDNKETLEAVPAMVAGRFGWDFSLADFTAYGVDILKKEIDFNRRAGLGQADDRLPEFFLKEKLPPHNVVFDVREEDLDKVLKF